MKRLLVYCTQLLERGGIESHILQFCQVMAERGVSIDLVVLRAELAETDLKTYRRVCRKVYLNDYSQKPARMLWLAKTIAVLGLNNYDAIYTNGQGKTIPLFGKLTGHNRRWVHHHHTSGDQTDRATWPAAYVEVFSRADTVIACSTKNAGMISDALGVDVATIPCYSRSVPAMVSPRKAGDKIKLGYYGRLIPEKGIQLICELSKDERLAHCEFHIWGVPTQFDEAYFSSFLNVNFHGPFAGRKELVEVVNMIDVFLLLSVHPEGLPISLLEITSSGTPWVATDRGGVVDIAVDEDYTILLPPTPTYEESLSAILTLTRKLANTDQAGARLVSLYEERFSAEAITSQWEETLTLG